MEKVWAFFHFHFSWTDSPLTFTVVDSGIARAWGPGLSKALVDSLTKFFLSARSVSAQGKPMVQITAPNRESVRCSVVPAKSGNEGEYEVTFTPEVVGTYDIDVLWNGKNIPGRYLLAPLRKKMKVLIIIMNFFRLTFPLLRCQYQSSSTCR